MSKPLEDDGPNDFDRMTEMLEQAKALRKLADLAAEEQRRQLQRYREFVRQAHDLEEKARRIENDIFRNECFL